LPFRRIVSALHESVRKRQHEDRRGRDENQHSPGKLHQLNPEMDVEYQQPRHEAENRTDCVEEQPENEVEQNRQECSKSRIRTRNAPTPPADSILCLVVKANRIRLV